MLLFYLCLLSYGAAQEECAVPLTYTPRNVLDGTYSICSNCAMWRTLKPLLQNILDQIFVAAWMWLENAVGLLLSTC